MILLFLTSATRTRTSAWRTGSACVETGGHPDAGLVRRRRGGAGEKICRAKIKLTGAALCSVVPRATPLVQKAFARFGSLTALELNRQNDSRRGH
jgi:hypothetical protein